MAEKDLSELFIDASLLVDKKPEIISLSPSFDYGLGGGISRNSIVICSGKQKTGKTTLALSFAAQFQKATPDSLVHYVDTEGRLQPRNFEIEDLDIKRIKVLKPTKDCRTAEDFLKATQSIMDNNKRGLIIFDSLSALCSKHSIDVDPDGQIRAVEPKLLAHFFKKTRQAMSMGDHIFWSIHHIQTGMTQYAGTTEDGGVKIQYYADFKIRAKASEYYPKDDQPIGQNVTWSIEFTALGPPHRKVESFIRYGVGVDKRKELIDFAINTDVIKKKGSWYVYEEVKQQGEESLYQWFKENPKELDKLEKQYREFLK